MLRCPNGTRKNKRTGICEGKNTSSVNKNTSRKQQLEIKIKECLDDLKKFKNYKNLTEQKKYHKLIAKCRDLDNKIENLDENKHLTETEVLSIMDPYNIDDKEAVEIKRKLMALTYSEKYKSCFSGKKTKNLYYMADDKLACFFKYGDQI
jgi:hypothetical protein